MQKGSSQSNLHPPFIDTIPDHLDAHVQLRRLSVPPDLDESRPRDIRDLDGAIAVQEFDGELGRLTPGLRQGRWVARDGPVHLEVTVDRATVLATLFPLSRLNRKGQRRLYMRPSTHLPFSPQPCNFYR